MTNTDTPLPTLAEIEQALRVYEQTGRYSQLRALCERFRDALRAGAVLVTQEDREAHQRRAFIAGYVSGAQDYCDGETGGDMTAEAAKEWALQARRLLQLDPEKGSNG